MCCARREVRDHAARLALGLRTLGLAGVWGITASPPGKGRHGWQLWIETHEEVKQ